MLACVATAAFFHFANAPGRVLRFSDGSTFTLQSVRIGAVAGPSDNILTGVLTQVQRFIAERTGWLPHPSPRRHFETRFDHDHLLVEVRLIGHDQEGDILFFTSDALENFVENKATYPQIFPAPYHFNRLVRLWCFEFLKKPVRTVESISTKRALSSFRKARHP